MSLHESEAGLVAEVSLESSKEIDWVLQYDHPNLHFEGFRQFNGGSSNIVAAMTETRVSHRGHNRYIFFFTQKSRGHTPLTMRIFSAEELVFEETLDPQAGK
jgi:hypothetical protein